MEKRKRTALEISLAAAEKQMEKEARAALRNAERERSKAEKEASKKPKPTELELAERQGQRMLHDMLRVQNTQMKSTDMKEFREGVDVCKDTDFYFCVVFQSSVQKYKFVEAFSKMYDLGLDEVRTANDIFQIFNGLKLAERLQIKLIPERLSAYPYPSLELMPMALDNEELEIGVEE
jgi:hypothetical protein